MNIEEFREYCLSFENVTESTPFDNNTLVFKVFGKMFALADIENFTSFNVKCNREIAEELRLQYACVKAGYHMNKKHWNTIEVQQNELNDQELKHWIKHSYELVLQGIPKNKRIDILKS